MAPGPHLASPLVFVNKVLWEHTHAHELRGSSLVQGV